MQVFSVRFFLQVAIRTTRWIDIATQLVVRRRQPESKVRVKELLRHQNHSRVTPPMSTTGSPKNSIRHGLRKSSIPDAVEQQMVPTKNQMDVSIAPSRRELAADIMEPRRLSFERLALDGDYISAGKQSSILVHRQARIHHCFVCRYPCKPTSTVSNEIGNLMNKGRRGEIKRIVDNGPVSNVTVVSRYGTSSSGSPIKTNPLKLHIRQAKGSVPSTCSLTFVRQLNIANDFSKG
jgi:hypothetical protein